MTLRSPTYPKILFCPHCGGHRVALDATEWSSNVVCHDCRRRGPSAGLDYDAMTATSDPDDVEVLIYQRNCRAIQQWNQLRTGIMSSISKRKEARLLQRYPPITIADKVNDQRMTRKSNAINAYLDAAEKRHADAVIDPSVAEECRRPHNMRDSFNLMYVKWPNPMPEHLKSRFGAANQELKDAADKYVAAFARGVKPDVRFQLRYPRYTVTIHRRDGTEPDQVYGADGVGVSNSLDRASGNRAVTILLRKAC